jgi:hypothetical protein
MTLCLLAALSATACTSADDAASRDPVPSPPESSGATQSASREELGETAAASGSLTVRESGRLCVDKTISENRTFTYGYEILESTGPLDVESVDMVEPKGFRIVNAWLMPSRGIEHTGSWFGWPLPKWVRSGDKLAWHQRQRASGAQLEPGTYNLLVRLRRSPGPEVQGFDALRIEYRSGEGQVDTVETRTPVRFRTDCA